MLTSGSVMGKLNVRRIALSSMLIVALFTFCDGDKELMCSVCHAVIDEIESGIKKVDPRKMIQVGSYRIEPTGDQKKEKIQYAYSEVHLNEVLENLCSSMEDYAQAKYKDTGKLTIIKLIGPNGGMNPDISKVDLQPDTELNSKLKFYCETIINEYDDDIIRIFTKREKKPDFALCTTASGYCPGEQLDVEDYGFENDEL